MSIESNRPKTFMELARRIERLRPEDSYNSLGIGLFSSPPSHVELIQRLSQEILLFEDCYFSKAQNLLITNLQGLADKTKEKINLIPLISAIGRETKKIAKPNSLATLTLNYDQMSESKRSETEDPLLSLLPVHQEMNDHNTYVARTPVKERMGKALGMCHLRDPIQARQKMLDLLIEESETIQLNHLLYCAMNELKELGNQIITPIFSDSGVEQQNLFPIYMRMGRFVFDLVNCYALVLKSDVLPKKEILRLKEIDNFLDQLNLSINSLRTSIDSYQRMIKKIYIIVFNKFFVIPKLIKSSEELMRLITENPVKTTCFYSAIAPYLFLSGFRINQIFNMEGLNQAEIKGDRNLFRQKLVQSYQSHLKDQEKLYQLIRKSVPKVASSHKKYSPAALTYRYFHTSALQLPSFKLVNFSRELKNFLDRIEAPVSLRDVGRNKDAALRNGPSDRSSASSASAGPRQVVIEEVVSPLDDDSTEVGAVQIEYLGDAAEESQPHDIEEVVSPLDDDSTVVGPVQVEYLGDAAEESQPEFNYDFRASRWLSHASLSEELDPDVFPEYMEYSDKNQKKMIYYHGFSSNVDQFYESGFQEQWINTTTNHPDTQYVLPAEFEIEGEKVRGAIIYCFGEDGLCYHRFFHPMDPDTLIKRFREDVFEQADFPELGVAEAMQRPDAISVRFVAEDVIEENPLLNTVQIQDTRLNITITLFKRES